MLSCAQIRSVVVAQTLLHSPFCALQSAVKPHTLYGEFWCCMAAGSLYCCVSTSLLLDLAAIVAPRDKNLHPNVPRDARAKLRVHAPKIHIVERRNNYIIGATASVSFGAQTV